MLYQNNSPFIYGSALMGYAPAMIKIFYISAVLLVPALIGPIAEAASCEDLAASRVASKPGAQILGVRTEKDASGSAICVVTVREKGKPGARPRVVTRKFRP